MKKENVHLDEQYFDVISSKTENGIRKVPIADKVLPFYKAWFEDNQDCEYLIHTPDGKYPVEKGPYAKAGTLVKPNNNVAAITIFFAVFMKILPLPFTQ